MELIAEEKKHSPYGGSSAKRWGHCPGSISAIATATKLPKDMTAAWQGTAQHTLAEHMLKNGLFDAPETLEVFVEDQKISVSKEDMQNVVEYVQEVRRCYDNVASNTNCVPLLLIEQTLPLFKDARYGAFGTLDAAVISKPHRPDCAVIYDYKSGRIPFEFDKDSLDQAGYLAVALKSAYPSLEEVEVRIYQPNTGVPITCWRFDKKALKAVAKKFERAIIDSKKENPQFFSGDYCHYCPALAECPEYRKMVEETAQKEFGGIDIVSLATIPAPSALSPAKVKTLLAMKTALSKYFDAVEDFWTAEAIAGRCPEGMKLVKGRSGKRDWRLSETEVFEELQKRGVGTEQMYETNFRTPPSLEKRIGKGINLSDLVQQKDGKPSLVPLEDPRPGLVKDELIA